MFVTFQYKLFCHLPIPICQKFALNLFRTKSFLYIMGEPLFIRGRLCLRLATQSWVKNATIMPISGPLRAECCPVLKTGQQMLVKSTLVIKMKHLNLIYQ